MRLALRFPIRFISSFVVLAAIGFSVVAFFSAPVTASERFETENIISDSVFTNYQSMNVAQIQNFLESKGSTCLANFRSLSLYDDNRDGVGDEPYGRGVNEQVSAATLIWQAAQIFKINPQVILATLQKEQGLITRDDCPNWRYNTALGYGCPDSQPCDTAVYGFTRQIDVGVWHFRGFFDDSYPIPPTIPGSKFIAYNPDVGRCGGKTITIQNKATAALYSYTPYQPNSATLAAAPGQIVDCGAYGNINFWRYFTQWFGSTHYEESLLNFKSHVSYVGWTEVNTNRGVAGRTGQNRPMEAFKINGEVEYSSYNLETGWQPTITNGMISGTVGQRKPIQAIKITPTGSLATKYDIYYRAHVSYVGWMGWTKNGQSAGFTGDSGKNIEAFEIQLLPKDANPPGPTTNPYQTISTPTTTPAISINAASHIGSVGWQPAVTDGMTSGITEQSRRIEAVKLTLANRTGLPGSLTYSAHVANIGWQDIRSNDSIAGTTGQFKQMEAIRIAFTGQLADTYDIWYRGYVQYSGWSGWGKNGKAVGSVGASRQLEAIELRIVPKNSLALSEYNNLYNPSRSAEPDSYYLGYSTHIGYVGWTPSTTQNTTSGSVGQKRSLEAVRIDNVSSLFGDIAISCSVYLGGTGWTTPVTAGNNCGTTGQKRAIQAIRLNLTGGAAEKYDLSYKVHSSWVGWRDWTENNAVAGLPANTTTPIEAIVIKLTEK